MLVDGKWVADWQPVQKADEQGPLRPPDLAASATGSRRMAAPARPAPAGFKAEAGRYRLYVALICPWASRTLIARKLKGLVDADPGDRGEPGADRRRAGSSAAIPARTRTRCSVPRYMHEIYTRADPHYYRARHGSGPVGHAANVMVSNESADILRMFDTAFEHLVPVDHAVFIRPTWHPRSTR